MNEMIVYGLMAVENKFFTQIIWLSYDISVEKCHYSTVSIVVFYIKFKGGN
jgi:hypothetical protein